MNSVCLLGKMIERPVGLEAGPRVHTTADPRHGRILDPGASPGAGPIAVPRGSPVARPEAGTLEKNSRAESRPQRPSPERRADGSRSRYENMKSSRGLASNEGVAREI